MTRWPPHLTIMPGSLRALRDLPAAFQQGYPETALPHQGRAGRRAGLDMRFPRDKITLPMNNEQIAKLHFQVGPEANKQKLGEYLFENLNGLSKMYLRELIKMGRCEVNGLLENSGYKLRANDFIEIEADLSRGT